ncbi:hypothetical protein NQ318_000399 [Aromia moschata]|uniref:Plastocyanin-like domain-containing protein n=1 Tax=Aromia moschata TaxID=1265417 RepID=A0AAV8YWC2_9CUCU|nr:hypothetical protein NQ318_000399 [Aromia moschata]
MSDNLIFPEFSFPTIEPIPSREAHGGMENSVIGFIHFDSLITLQGINQDYLIRSGLGYLENQSQLRDLVFGFGFSVSKAFGKIYSGYWIFHCHIEFHAEIGMAMVIKVGDDEQMLPVPKNFPKCGDYKPEYPLDPDCDNEACLDKCKSNGILNKIENFFGDSCSTASRITSLSYSLALLIVCRKIGENIIGPFFIYGNLNRTTYLALLQNNVVPTKANSYPAEGNPQLPCNTIWFQQDVYVPLDEVTLKFRLLCRRTSLLTNNKDQTTKLNDPSTEVPSKWAKPGDYERRVTFLAWLATAHEDDNISSILWTYESRFHNNGTINRHNCHYWSEDNPHWMRETNFERIWGINVWCGMIDGYIIGPKFYGGTLPEVLPLVNFCIEPNVALNQMDNTLKIFFSIISGAHDDAASVLALHSVREAPRSLRRRAIETEISKSHLQRIFKQNRILPFKPKFRHTLEDGDEAKRLDFCLEMGNIVLNDVGFHKRILFSDESTFSTNGVVSSKHCRYWSETNLHFTISCRRQYFKQVNVWCVVSCTNSIIENLNRNTHLEMLQNFLTDKLDELPLSYRTRMFFQQDGCPAHHAVTVRNWLNSEFNEHWI